MFGMLGKFRYLNLGLAAVLVFVGLKMMLSDVVHLPIYVSLAVIIGTLAAAVLASILRPVPAGGEEETAPPPVDTEASQPEYAART